jgi:hypothetical protein
MTDSMVVHFAGREYRRDRPVWMLLSMSEEEREPHEQAVYPLIRSPSQIPDLGGTLDGY